MSTKYVYICDHCGAECTDKFEFSIFGQWARRDAQYIPDNVHGCTREHTVLAIAKILGIGIDGSARDLIEEQRVELKNLRYKVQKLENANDVNLAHIAAFESRRNVIADELLESLQRVRRRALDFARPHGMDECAVVDVDTITNTIDAEIASLTGPKKPTKPVADHVHELGSCTYCDTKPRTMVTNCTICGCPNERAFLDPCIANQKHNFEAP